MSKLSLHISDWLNPELTYEFIERTRPSLIKVFGDAGLDDAKIREAKTRSPASVFVGRMYFPDQGIERDEKTPVDTVFHYDPLADARNAFNQMRGIIEKTRGLVNVWEGYNEIPIDTAHPLTERERQKARNYNAFTVEMARLMHEAGLQYAAYSFSTGNPVHVELWDLLADGLRASDYLALHEYIAPNEAFSEFDFGMCNRYRQIYARVPENARKPILITECGADYLGQQGFKGKISVPKYLSMLGQYDAELMKDAYVVGASIYCYGINAPQWKTYDIGGDFAKALRDYIQNNPTPPLENPIVETPVETKPARRHFGVDKTSARTTWQWRRRQRAYSAQRKNYLVVLRLGARTLDRFGERASAHRRALVCRRSYARHRSGQIGCRRANFARPCDTVAGIARATCAGHSLDGNARRVGRRARFLWRAARAQTRREKETRAQEKNVQEKNVRAKKRSRQTQSQIKTQAKVISLDHCR
ncbi:MAG: hypothetical protein DCC52_14260 [Chloroflexi bacterium]|nr:MAG: hypothetical protein DCC52_14260 [Chloroflexota bacterium]